MTAKEIEKEKERVADKKRTRELVEATMDGYRLAVEHFEKYGSFMGNKERMI